MSTNKRMVFNVSFKQQEVWLYDLISKSCSPSAKIKDILIEYYSNQTEIDKQIEHIDNNSNVSNALDMLF